MLADLLHALRLILTADREVWQVAAVSLQVSVSALALATAVSLPLAYALSVTSRRRLAGVATWLIHTATAFPTVVVGLTLYFVLSNTGPLGWMGLLYTRTAMTVGQFVLALPIVTAVSLVALNRLGPEVRETVRTLGLSGLTAMRLQLSEIRPALISGMLIAFARVFTELGAAIILGGNIRGATRTLTTVIALEYDRGDSARAIALGLVLLVVALTVNALAHRAVQEGRR
jgi:tungstate transport system permease protein